MSTRFVLVHGINNQEKSVSEIQSSWMGALRDSVGQSVLESVDVATAYYADVLYAETKSWSEASDTVTPMSSNSPDSDFASAEVTLLYQQIQQAYGITDDQVKEYLDPADAKEPVERMGRGIHKKWLQAIARALEDLIPGAAPGVAKAFLPQAAAYLHKPGLYDKINSLVRSQVFSDRDHIGQTIVIGHSLGTIVTYVLLRGMRALDKAPLFLTLGSPLGIEIVKDRIGPAYLTPHVVDKWVNGSDPEDFVALHKSLDAQTFGPATVINITDIDNGFDDPHSIEKYLSNAKVAQQIKDAMTN